MWFRIREITMYSEFFEIFLNQQESVTSVKEKLSYSNSEMQSCKVAKLPRCRLLRRAQCTNRVSISSVISSALGLGSLTADFLRFNRNYPLEDFIQV